MGVYTMLDKINSEIIKTENDILVMLDNLLERRDSEWWNNFYCDKEKPIPFLKIFLMKTLFHTLIEGYWRWEML